MSKEREKFKQQKLNK